MLATIVFGYVRANIILRTSTVVVGSRQRLDWHKFLLRTALSLRLFSRVTSLAESLVLVGKGVIVI